MLASALDRGIASVIAPAGYGKTEAIRGFFEKAHVIHVAKSGASTELFAVELIRSVSPAEQPGLSAVLLSGATIRNAGKIATWVAHRLQRSTLPIVVDDFENGSDDRIFIDFFTTLIELTAPKTRWIIAGRTAGQLPILRWLESGLAVPSITAMDLRFTVDDLQHLAESLDLSIPREVQEELLFAVDGWPIGARISLELWSRTCSLPELKLRTADVLFDFLREEFWQTLSATERRTLFAAAALSKCDAVMLRRAGLVNGVGTLHKLSQRMPLIIRPNHDVYRLHDLLRSFVLSCSTQFESDEYFRILDSLATALEGDCRYVEALMLYLRTQNEDAIIAALERIGIDAIDEGCGAVVRDIISGLSRAYSNSPIVRAILGYLYALEGSDGIAFSEMECALNVTTSDRFRAQIEFQLATLEVSLRKPLLAISRAKKIALNDKLDEGLRLSATARLAAAYAFSGDNISARTAIDYCLSHGDNLSIKTRAIVRAGLGTASSLLGDYDQAHRFSHDAIILGEAAGLDSLVARAYAMLCYSGAYLGRDLPTLYEYCASIVKYGSRCSDQVVVAYGLEMRFQLGVFADDHLATSALHDMTTMEKRNGTAPSNAVARAHAEAIYHYNRGDLVSALRLLRLPRDVRSSPVFNGFLIALQALLLAKSSPHEARALFTDLVIPVQIRDSVENEAIRRLSLAYAVLAGWILGKQKFAKMLAEIDASNGLWYIDGPLLSTVVMLIRCSRNDMTALRLKQITEPLFAVNLGGYARLLREALAPDENRVNLTPTERRVIVAFAQRDATTKSVAEQLGMRPRTVQTHVKRAIFKIGCSGRSAAVAYARDMGWTSNP